MKLVTPWLLFNAIYCWAPLSTRTTSLVSAFTLTMRKGGNVPATKYTKSNLPSKMCVTCGRPFEWRKKWERCWDEVKYCSDRCRGNRSGGGGGGGSGEKGQELVGGTDDEVEANAKGYNSPRRRGA
jgi:hypothetical protein